jgi:hypothetical protein
VDGTVGRHRAVLVVIGVLVLVGVLVLAVVLGALALWPRGRPAPASRWIGASRLHILIPRGDRPLEEAQPAARRCGAGERPA